MDIAIGRAPKKYVLGGHTFDNIDDFWNAKQDMKKIDIISKNLDTRDPEVAIRLYNLIRDGGIEFKSPIGLEFTEHVTDVLADKSINLIDSKKTVEAADKKVKKQWIIGVTVVTLAVAASLIFGSSQIGEILTARDLEKMAASTRAVKIDNEQREQIAKLNADTIAMVETLRAERGEEVDPFNTDIFVDEANLTVLPEYESLLAQNKDVRGWLEIAGTNVNYPVMQRAGDTTNDYYLRRNFNEENDSNGSLFIDYRSDIVNPTENTIIYGHNMNSGMMFGDLKNYLDEEYFKAHKAVKFNTLYEERDYEIVAVCLSKVQDSDSNNFRYYNFIDAKNPAEWSAFVDNVNYLSIFTGSVDLEEGDQVLTLSTCNNYTEDGRLFLVAKRIN